MSSSKFKFVEGIHTGVVSAAVHKEGFNDKLQVDSFSMFQSGWPTGTGGGLSKLSTKSTFEYTCLFFDVVKDVVVL